jgi:hypothetical protein
MGTFGNAGHFLFYVPKNKVKGKINCPTQAKGRLEWATRPGRCYRRNDTH